MFFLFFLFFPFFMKLPCWAFCQSSHNARLILLWNGSTFKLQIDKANVLKNATAKDLHEHRDLGEVGWRISGLLTLFFKFTRMQLVSMLSNLTHHQIYFYGPYCCHRLLSNHLTNTTTWYLQKLLQISLSISFPDSLATFLCCGAYRPRKWSAKQLNAGTC